MLSRQRRFLPDSFPLNFSSFLLFLILIHCAALFLVLSTSWNKELNEDVTLFSLSSRSVTLEGDSFDPSGTLEGGSRSTSSSILIRLQEVAKIYEELNEAKEELREVSRLLERLKGVSVACSFLSF